MGRKDETDMNNREMIDDLDERFGGASKRERTPEKKYIRVKDATERHGIGRTKLTQIAREAGAVIKIDSTVLIDAEALEGI